MERKVALQDIIEEDKVVSRLTGNGKPPLTQLSRPRSARSIFAGRYGLELIDHPETLKHAIVYAEILGRPVGLRAQSSPHQS